MDNKATCQIKDLQCKLANQPQQRHNNSAPLRAEHAHAVKQLASAQHNIFSLLFLVVQWESTRPILLQISESAVQAVPLGYRWQRAGTLKHSQWRGQVTL